MSADAVLLLAYGGPTRPEEIRPFLEHVTRGRRIPPERLEAVAHHYEIVGGRSPLNELTFEQAELLRAALGRQPVYVGMRVWTPFVADAMASMAATGIGDAVGLILSPFACDASRGRYHEATDEARAGLGPRAPHIRWAGTWHLHPGFIEAMADRVTEAGPRDATLVFTNHSIPVAMADASPYVAEFEAAAAAVAARVGTTDWRLAYQSRSGSPRDPWLEPDVNNLLRELAATGTRRVVLVPIGFVCDHVEVLYDLDVEARETARQLGLDLARAGTAGNHPRFIEALADVIREAGA